MPYFVSNRGVVPKRLHIVEDGHAYTACGNIPRASLREPDSYDATYLPVCQACRQCSQRAGTVTGRTKNFGLSGTPAHSIYKFDTEWLSPKYYEYFEAKPFDAEYLTDILYPKRTVEITPKDAENLRKVGDTFKGDKNVTIKVVEPPKPTYEYEVFVRFDLGAERAGGVRPREADQRRVVKATDHKAAVIDAAKRSEHTSNTHYVAVGHSEAGESFARRAFTKSEPRLTDTRTMMIFEIIRITEPDWSRSADFTGPAGGRYAVKAL